MEKAWIDFKTDEETFKTLIKYEEDYVYDIMKKKYGKDFDGINVKGTIKRSDIYKYNLAELLVKMDVLCAEKLKAKNKNLIGFFNSNTTLMSRKLCLTYDLTPQELESAINKVSPQYRDIFTSAFGINRKKEKLSIITSLFNISTDDIYQKLMFALHEFENIIKTNKDNPNKIVQKKISIPTSLVTFLEKFGYRKEAIVQMLSTYETRIRIVLHKYYGQKYDKVRSPLIPVSKEDAEIILNIISGPDSVIERLKKSEVPTKQIVKEEAKEKQNTIPIKSFNLIKFYEEKGYTVNEFIEAYRSLRLDEQDLIKQKFDKNFNEIYNSHLTSEENEKIYKLTKDENEGIGKLIKEERINKDKLKQKIVEKTQSKEEIKESSENDKATKKSQCISISNYKTLNDYYKDRGFTEEDLESLYSNLKKGGQKHFDKYIDVKEENGKHIFNIKSTILRSDKTAYGYFTTTAIITFKKSIQSGEKIKECIQTKIETKANCLEETNIFEEDTDNIKSFEEIKESVESYLNSLKKANIITRDLIINTHLPKKCEYFLLTEFDVNYSGEYSLDEEASFLNMSTEELCKNLVEVVLCLKNEIDTRLTINPNKIDGLLNNTKNMNDEKNIKKTLN